MAYSAQADIINVLPEEHVKQLTNDTDGSSVISGVLNAAIEYADAIINSYLRGKHTVPFSPVPTLIKHISVDLAIWRLYSRRNLPWFEHEGSVNDLKDAAMAQLEEIRVGTLLIDTPNDAPNTGKLYFASRKNVQPTLISQDDLNCFFPGPGL